MGLAATPVGTAAEARGVGPGPVGPSDPWGCLGAGEAAGQRAGAAGRQVRSLTRLFLDRFFFPSRTSILAGGIAHFSFWL